MFSFVGVESGAISAAAHFDYTGTNADNRTVDLGVAYDVTSIRRYSGAMGPTDNHLIESRARNDSGQTLSFMGIMTSYFRRSGAGRIRCHMHRGPGNPTEIKLGSIGTKVEGPNMGGIEFRVFCLKFRNVLP